MIKTKRHHRTRMMKGVTSRSRVSILDLTIDEIIHDHPESAPVFEAYGFEGTRESDRILSSVSLQDSRDLLSLVTRLFDPPGSDAGHCSFGPHELGIVELIDHIVSVHHRYLYQALPRLDRLAQDMASIHGGDFSELIELSTVFRSFQHSLEIHLMEEELMLFPTCRRLANDPPMTDPPWMEVQIRNRTAEHEEFLAEIGRIVELMGLLSSYDRAIDTVRTLFNGVSALFAECRNHFNEEDHVLFPLALKLEKSVEAV